MEKINKVAKHLQCIFLEKILNNIPENIKLEKKEINGTIIYKSPEIIAEQYNISRCLYFDKYNEIVIEFAKKLEDNFSHCNLSSFYNNMETAEIKDKIKDFKTLLQKLKYKNANALYDTEKNRIQLISLDIFSSTLSHELLHLSSRKKIGEIILSGFEQKDVRNNTTIGYYLNEGYTEYLNQKYFSKKDRNVYKYAQLFAQGIEMIVGAKKMEALYFDANLLGLIDELGKYCSKEEAIILVKKIDCFYELLLNNKESTKIHEEILTMIANIHRTKLKQELTEGKITEAEHRKRKLLYCDEYEIGRVNSKNIEIEEYEEYFLIIDNDKHESHFHRKDKNIDYKENSNYNIKTNIDGILQFEIPNEVHPLDEATKKKK